MKATITDYAIFCTEEQTRKAIELGARMETTSSSPSTFFCSKHPNRFLIHGLNDAKTYTCAIPTAEQMVSWLETVHKVKIYVTDLNMESDCPTDCHWNCVVLDEFYCPASCTFARPSRKDATLTAIDAALEFLLKNKMRLEFDEDYMYVSFEYAKEASASLHDCLTRGSSVLHKEGTSVNEFYTYGRCTELGNEPMMRKMKLVHGVPHVEMDCYVPSQEELDAKYCVCKLTWFPYRKTIR